MVASWLVARLPGGEVTVIPSEYLSRCSQCHMVKLPNKASVTPWQNQSD